MGEIKSANSDIVFSVEQKPYYLHYLAVVGVVVGVVVVVVVVGVVVLVVVVCSVPSLLSNGAVGMVTVAHALPQVVLS
jgi:hypothetical protein